MQYTCKESDYMGIWTYMEHVKQKNQKEYKIRQFLKLKKLVKKLRNQTAD